MPAMESRKRKIWECITGDCPAQFLPSSGSLEEKAVTLARATAVEGIPTRVMTNSGSRGLCTFCKSLMGRRICQTERVAAGISWGMGRTDSRISQTDGDGGVLTGVGVDSAMDGGCFLRVGGAQTGVGVDSDSAGGGRALGREGSASRMRARCLVPNIRAGTKFQRGSETKALARRSATFQRASDLSG